MIEVNRAAERGRANSARASDQPLICFSHLRWNFVFQRPQHLMSRFAAERRVIFWEEPEFGDFAPRAHSRVCDKTGVEVVTPHLPDGLDETAQEEALRSLLDSYLADTPGALIRWYYTPMMLAF